MPEPNATDLRHAHDWTERLRKVAGPDIFASSSVGDGLAERLAAEGKRWRCILEIGTHRAAATVVLACFAETVISIDVVRQPHVAKVLAALPYNIRDRIATVIVPDNDAKVLLARHLDFDLAFVDGGHTEGQTFLDFAITRECGDVLFHDYPQCGRDARGVGMLVDRVKDGRFVCAPPFAWWKAAGA